MLAGQALAALVIALGAAWGALALAVRGPARLRVPLAVAWLAAAALALHALYDRAWAGLAPFAAAALWLAWWWRGIKPSLDRPWQAEVARLLAGSADGHRVRLSNVRDFQWRGVDDFDARWRDDEYDLGMLESVDLVLSYWGRAAIAHTMVSFGFADGRHLVFSVEIRRKVGEKFSELGGFFRQYERCIVAATERDCMRVRTNIRGEEGYLYRVRMPREGAQALFLAYVHAANQLRERPRFYNTLTANCTTIVFRLAEQVAPGLPLDYRLLLSGYLPGYLYDLDALEGVGTLAERRAAARYTERARAEPDPAAYSAAIRAPSRAAA
ncbi:MULTISPECIES: DUF4105 domain-containing protein [Bordetella]|uniref:Lnb N-terminal periplasmic domain-containing protein n=1 Tax=Bordetella genomosp. 6 TaxID=463024 RepID=A0ABX4F9G8_9BORD|nr:MULTISPECIES: DUF4105 domain-containing protein [Bordetella]AOB25681.1 hypothetical protein BBB44_05055 [Bordetella bronchiseptica]AZW42941.1 DUF4105 domain-containing protein [Bordetella bronchiseptica]KCV65932.1 PF13387 domain protein [Bordetella bronchiseptica 99-R-0433]MBN3268374.1 DUF4105 domain-containing protein [Bordetella bronchiseptica]OZI73187.1 hypothetical protein CAL23_18630 [Bordetella genomosp. 6]